MAISTAQLATDFDAILADLPETMTVSATDYSVNRVSLSRNDWETMDRQTLEDTKVVLSGKAAAMPSLSVGDSLTYESETYQILEIVDSPDGIDRRFFLAGEYA